MSNKNKKYTNWELDNKIEKIISSTCKEIPWEGTEVDKYSLSSQIKELIYELAPEYKPNYE